MKTLLVEDNPADARLIREILKESPTGTFQVQQAARLDSALERLRQETFAVVLLDLGLPDSQGMETLTLMQKASGGVPIVVLTGRDDQGFALEAVRAGAQDYLIKGRFDSELLVRTIRYAVQRKQAEEEVRRLNAELERRVAERTAQLQTANDELLKEIVERKRTEEALRESESLYRELFEHMAEGLAYCKMIFENGQGRDFVYLAVNPAFETLTGLKEVVGKKATEVIPGIRVSDPELFEIYGRVALTGVPEKFEMFVEAMEMWFAISVYSPEKGFIVVIFDVITERKRAEEALIRTEKLAVTGRLAATMAHEINNPLEAMTNLVYLLGKSIKDASTREYVDTIEKQLQTISRITNQTLKFHRENVSPTEFDLAELIGELVEFYRPKAGQHGVTVVQRLDAEAKVLGFSGEISQVISNLLLNAIEATPQGGRVTLHLYPSSDKRGVNRSGYRISIADTGGGIDAQHLPRIFEPFFTTKGENGTGLGLWVSMGIINRAGGFIRVRSTQRPGRSGTCFSIFLPAEVPVAEIRHRRRYEATPPQISAGEAASGLPQETRPKRKRRNATIH